MSKLGARLLAAVTAEQPPVRKYRNHVVVTADGRFDSKAELARWHELKLLQTAGQIRALRRQVRHRLVVNGELVCEFVPDFEYLEDGRGIVTEDVKSPSTARNPAYRIKKKLFEALYRRPVVEVGAKRGRGA
jgi:hypothetical protein